MEKFNLGATLDKNVSLDNELSLRLGTMSAKFVRITNRVWINKHLTVTTKARVYEACVLTVLLYGADSWLTYCPQENKISAFCTRSHSSIIRIMWEDEMTKEHLFIITWYWSPLSIPKFMRVVKEGRLQTDWSTSTPIQRSLQKRSEGLWNLAISEQRCMAGSPLFWKTKGQHRQPKQTEETSQTDIFFIIWSLQHFRPWQMPV